MGSSWSARNPSRKCILCFSPRELMGTIPGSTTTITPENAENMINWIIKPMINDSILKRKLWQPEQDIYLYVRLILDKYTKDQCASSRRICGE